MVRIEDADSGVARGQNDTPVALPRGCDSLDAVHSHPFDSRTTPRLKATRDPICQLAGRGDRGLRSDASSIVIRLQRRLDERRRVSFGEVAPGHEVQDDRGSFPHLMGADSSTSRCRQGLASRA